MCAYTDLFNRNNTAIADSRRLQYIQLCLDTQAAEEKFGKVLTDHMPGDYRMAGVKVVERRRPRNAVGQRGPL